MDFAPATVYELNNESMLFGTKRHLKEADLGEEALDDNLVDDLTLMLRDKSVRAL